MSGATRRDAREEIRAHGDIRRARIEMDVRSVFVTGRGERGPRGGRRARGDERAVYAASRGMKMAKKAIKGTEADRKETRKK